MAPVPTSKPDVKTLPNHYQGFGPNNIYEPIKIISALDLNFNVGNIVKYTLRAGKKGGESKLDDLRKTAYYAMAEVKRLEALEQSSADSKEDE